jgi:hypothetical protein
MDLSRLDGALVAGWKFWTVLSDSRLEKRSTVVTYLFFSTVRHSGNIDFSLGKRQYEHIVQGVHSDIGS